MHIITTHGIPSRIKNRIMSKKLNSKTDTYWSETSTWAGAKKSKIDLYLRLNRTKNRRIELKTKTKMENSHPKQISKAKTIQIHEDENHIINSTKTRLVYLERCVGLTTKTKSKCARALAKMEIDRKRNIGIFGRVFGGPAKLRTWFQLHYNLVVFVIWRFCPLPLTLLHCSFVRQKTSSNFSRYL